MPNVTLVGFAPFAVIFFLVVAVRIRRDKRGMKINKDRRSEIRRRFVKLNRRFN